MKEKDLVQSKLIDINSLVPNESNPRTIKDDALEKLVQSIKDFPEMLNLRPIVVDENNIILGGNMRYRAASIAGMKKVPVIIADGLTEEQKREFIIKDNVSGGEWDWEILANEWKEEELEAWGLDSFKPADFDLNNFFEESADGGESKKLKIILEYTEDDYNQVIELFKNHSGSKEEVVFKLLSE